MNALHKLQYISQGVDANTQWGHIRKALDHGAEWVQLRWKNAPTASCLALAEKVKARCESYRATLIINDSISIAQAVDADGVHLGLEDDSIEEARRILGNQKIVGGTANTLAHVKQRMASGCDYIGLGPYRHTITKEKLSPILGLRGYNDILEQLHADTGHVPPIYAIGGIGLADVPDLLELGVYGIALSQVITETPACITDFKKILA